MESSLPRFVILTSGYVNGRRVARALHNREVPFEIVTICFEPPRRGNSGLIRHLARQALAYAKSIRVLRQIAQRRLPRYPVPDHYAGFCNSARLIRTLERLRPDYIVMMGGGILSKDVIATARRGVINSHPGLLPWIRGVDTIEWAVSKGVAIGVTTHFIDAGIDTGDLIARYLLPVAPDDSPAQLQAMLTRLECAAMLETVMRLSAGEAVSRYAQREKHPLCKRMTPAERNLVATMIAGGRAAQLYESWRTRAGELAFRDAQACVARYSSDIAV